MDPVDRPRWARLIEAVADEPVLALLVVLLALPFAIAAWLSVRLRRRRLR